MSVDRLHLQLSVLYVSRGSPPPTTMTTITLEHVTKYFLRDDGTREPAPALNDISLRLHNGEVLAILGPSGSGKSTLLRVIAGLIQPDSGRVLHDNTPLEFVPMLERDIGFVFQEGALMPHWTARRSVDFFLRLRHREREAPERIQRIAAITGFHLDDLLNRRPKTMSGGERQRINIARALTRDLKILLLDEPFANLDARYRSEARVELKRLLNQFAVTTVYVTHDQVEAIALAQRIAVMREGRLEQIGTYQQLYESPVNQFVASFVGTPPMNFFAGHIRDGHWEGESFGGYPVRSDLPNGAEVTLGVRPQHIALKPGGTAGVVDIITPLMAERHKMIEVWLGRERWTILIALETPIEKGSTIYCAIDPQQALYFDTKRGVRIG